jgi:ATP-dependent DNA helicase RecG
VTKLTSQKVDQLFDEGIDFQKLSDLLNHDVTDVVDSIRVNLLTKSLTKSLTKIPDLVDYLNEERSRNEIFHFLGLENQTMNFRNHIKPLIDFGIIEMTLPDKPNSRFQKYRLTDKGKKLLKQSR